MPLGVQSILESIHSSQQSMISQLYTLCEINSGSENLAGIHTITQELTALFSPLSDETQLIPFPSISTIDLQGNNIKTNYGKALLFKKRPELKKRILLCGHMDTVFSANHPFQGLTRLNKNTLQGPGVTDMKGGLLVMLYALLAFEQHLSSSNIGWDVVINADEEVGSPASSILLEKVSQQVQAALVYEPSINESGSIAKDRKGSGKFTLLATGKAAHAGRHFSQGRNAIAYLAEALVLINSLNGQRENTTLNIGLISGGSALNAVPEKAVAKIDVRIGADDDQIWVKNKLNQIIKKMNRSGYTLTLHGNFGRPVKKVNPQTRALFNRIKQQAEYLDIHLQWENSGGCCDGNNLAKHGLPVIDTLGVRGGNIHSPNEYILLDSLTERASLSALILIDLANGGLEQLNRA